MKPDRAHRLLNTLLLVMILVLTQTESGMGAPITDVAAQLAVAAMMILLFYLMFRVLERYPDELRQYFGLEGVNGDS